MIEFYGELSEKSKDYILKREARTSCLAALIVSIILCVPIIILTITYHWIFIIWLPVLVILVLLSSIRPSKKYHGRILPKKIIIDGDEIICEGELFCYKALITHVKAIVDLGEIYHIIFYYAHKNARFVCQKDLLIKGTIDEFEKLFEGKIIRKK